VYAALAVNCLALIGALAVAPGPVDPRAIDPAAARPIMVGAAPDAEPTPADAPDRAPATKKRAAAAPVLVRAPPPGPCLKTPGQCRKLAITGISLSAVGTAVLGVGIGFSVAPDWPDPDEPVYNRTLQPIGAVLVAAAVTLLVTGATMILAARASHKRARKGARTK
jgi:hypothetical protein